MSLKVVSFGSYNDPFRSADCTEDEILGIERESSVIQLPSNSQYAAIKDTIYCHLNKEKFMLRMKEVFNISEATFLCL